MQINNENDFINELSDFSSKIQKIDWSILNEESKTELDSLEKEISNFIENTPILDDIDVEKQEELLMQAIEIWDRYKTAIKNAMCTLNFTVLEIRELYKKLHQSVKYTNETIFYGLHLKKYLLKDLPEIKGKQDYINYKLQFTFSMSVALYHLLETVEVVGLNKESYAFASILHKITEITKIYNEYDQTSARISQQIQMWNKGITQKIIGTNTNQNLETTESESQDTV